MKVLELKGYNSLGALNAFSALLLGLKMLPLHQMTPYVEFHESFKEMPDYEKESMIRQAISFVELGEGEVQSIVSFCCDENDVPYNKASLKNMDMRKIVEIIVAVCMEIGKIKIDLLTDDEKKN